MKKNLLLLAAFLLFSSHDMFLKMGTFFLAPHTDASINLYNGTFEKSENTIARQRMKDVSLVGNQVRTHPDTNQWSEIDTSITVLHFKTGEAGTWVAGLSTHPSQIALGAREFNEYLEHDGVLDMLNWRKQNNALNQDAVEKYSKHVKAIFQVGDKKTNDWQTILGYPVEFVPLANPYELNVGDTLRVKLLRDGQALPNQLVYAGSDGGAHGHSHADEGHSHDNSDAPHSHRGVASLRTDANGVVSLPITNDGQWYLRTIHLELSNEPGLTHESNWATLTFEVGPEKDGHHHDHTHSHGIPAWAYWAAGIVAIAALIRWFKTSR